MSTFEMESADMENPVADVAMDRFSGTRLDKIPREFVEAHVDPQHAGRERTATASVVLGEIGEARDFMQRASAVLSATKLPRNLTNSFATTAMRSMGNTVAQLKQVAPWAIGVLQWPVHLAVIFFAYTIVSWLEGALAREGLRLPDGAFKANLHRWWPLAPHSALQDVICDFQKRERESKADGTYVPWRQRTGQAAGLKRESALFVVETMYILVIIATFQLAVLGGPFCAFGCAVGVYCILKTHQMLYVVTAAYAPQPLFYADDFDHPMRLMPDDPRHGKDLVLDSAGVLVEFTDDQYRVELTMLDPGIPYMSKFVNYRKDQKHYSLQSKGFLLILTILSQGQILATESGSYAKRQPFGDSTAQDVADVLAALTVAVSLLETVLSIKRNPNSGSTAAVRDIVQRVGLSVSLSISMSGCLVDSTTCSLLAPGLDSQQCELTGDNAVEMAMELNITTSPEISPPESSLLTVVAFVSKLLLALGVTMNFVVIISKSKIWKTCRHRITLTSQVSKLGWSHWDGPDALTPPDGIATIPDWDVSTEIDIRAWRSVWDATLSSDRGLAAQHKRLLAQKIASQSVPAVAWSARSTEQQQAAMCTLIHELSGTDVYMNDEWSDGTSILTASHDSFEDKELTSDSKFGRMQVVPYPFHCSFEWDAENKGDSCHARLSLWSHPEKLQEMVELNQSPDIQRRREIRVLLRAVAACGAPLSFAHTITRRFAYTVTSGKGKKKVTTRHWEDVEVSFKRGVISVEETEGPSFRVSMKFEDGYGSGPKSGVHTNEINQLEHQDLGLTSSFCLTPALVRLFTENGNMHLCVPALLAYQEHDLYMREKSSQKLREETTALPADFWSAIYRESVPMAAFEQYLRIHEATFGNIDTKRFDHVRNASKLVAHIKQTGKQALWWLFWHDIVISNPEYEAFHHYPKDYSPFDTDSVCFKVMSRDELDEFLKSHGGFSLPESLLDSLYKALDEQEYLLPEYKPKWLTSNEQGQLRQLLTRPKTTNDSGDEKGEGERESTQLVVLRQISVRETPEEDTVENSTKESEMAGVQELEPGAMVEGLEEQFVEGNRCVRIGPSRWVTRVTSSGQINLREAYSSDSLDEVPGWIKILAAREGHSAKSWSMFLEQMVETPALSRRYFRVTSPVVVIGRGRDDNYTGRLKVGTEIEAVSVVDDLAGKSVVANTLELCSNRPMAIVSLSIVSLGVYEFVNVVQDMLDPDTYLQSLQDNGVTFRATQNLNAYKEVSADAQPTLVPKDSEIKPLEVAFVDSGNSDFAMFVRAEQGWMKTIDNETQLLKWHSKDDDDHHANKFGPQTVHFQLLCDTSVYKGLNGTEKIARARAGSIVEVTRYGPEKRYVSMKKNKDKEMRMELVNGGWLCMTMQKRKTKNGAETINVCAPCDPAMEKAIEEFASQPKHFRGTEYLEEVTSDAEGSRKVDIDLSKAVVEAGQTMIEEDSDAADAAVSLTVPSGPEDSKAGFKTDVAASKAKTKKALLAGLKSGDLEAAVATMEEDMANDGEADGAAASPPLDTTNAKARQFFACVRQSVPVFSSISGREGPCGQLLRHDVIEVVGITRGSNGQERLSFEGGHVNLDGMLDITDQIQFFDAPTAVVPDPATQLADMLEEMHDIDCGNDRYTGGVDYPRKYPTDISGAGEPTTAELHACGFPSDTTVEEINAAVMDKAARYGIQVAPLDKQLKKRDPHSFHFPRDAHGRLAHNAGIVAQYQTYSNLVANARGADPPLFPADPFEEEGASGSARGMAVPAPPGVMLPWNKNFIRRARPVKTGSMAANACFLLCSGSIILVMVVAALVSGSLPLLVVIGCFQCLYSITKDTKARRCGLVTLVVLQVSVVLVLQTVLGLLCGPLIGWPYDACLQSCDCTCTVGTIFSGLTITDGYSIRIAPDVPAQHWFNCAAARDEESCLYQSTNVDDSNGTLVPYDMLSADRVANSQLPQSFMRVPQCAWDEQAAVCTFKCNRIRDPNYCTQTVEWAAATANVSDVSEQHCSLLPEGEVELPSDASIGDMMIMFMQITALRDTASEFRCVDCHDSGDC